MFDVSRPPYNAKGDGVTDDTNAIQAAVWDALKYTMWTQAGDTRGDNQQTAKVWIPATRRHYRITRSIYVSGRNVSVEFEEGAAIHNSDTPWPLFHVGGFPGSGVPVALGSRWEPDRYRVGPESRPSAHPSQSLDGVSGLDSSIAPNANAWRGWRAKAPDRNCRFRLAISAAPANPGAATYTLRFRPASGHAGEVTAPIPYGSAPTVVQAALEALPSIDPGDVAVRVAPQLRPDRRNDDLEVEFAGKYANQYMTSTGGTLAVASASGGWTLAATLMVAGGPMYSTWIVPFNGINAGVDRSLLSAQEVVTFSFAARWPKNNHTYLADGSEQSILRGGLWGRPVDLYFLNNTFNLNFTLNNHDPMKGARQRYTIRATLPAGTVLKGVVRAHVQFDFTKATWPEIVTIWFGNDNAAPVKVGWNWSGTQPGGVTSPPVPTPAGGGPLRFYEEMDMPAVAIGGMSSLDFPHQDGFEILGLAIDGRPLFDPASTSQVAMALSGGTWVPSPGTPINDAYRFKRSWGDLRTLLAIDGEDVARHDGDVAQFGGHDWRYAVASCAGYRVPAVFHQIGRSGEDSTFTTEFVAIRGSRPGPMGVGGAILRPNSGSASIVHTHSLWSHYENLRFSRGLVGMYRLPPNIGNYGNRIANVESNVTTSMVVMPFQGFLSIDNAYIPGGCRLQAFTLPTSNTYITRVVFMDLNARRLAFLRVGDSSDLILRDWSISTEHSGLADCWIFVERGGAYEAHLTMENIRGNPTGSRTMLKLDDAGPADANGIGVLSVEVVGCSPTQLNYGSNGDPTIVTNGAQVTGLVRLPRRNSDHAAAAPRHLHYPAYSAAPALRLETWPVGHPSRGGASIVPTIA